MKDLFGKAILDYQTNNSPEDLITETSISEADEMSVAYLFRDFKDMLKLEQKALQLAKGKVWKKFIMWLDDKMFYLRILANSLIFIGPTYEEFALSNLY